MDEGPPSSYLLLARDTPVFCAEGGVAGSVKEVLCDRANDIFDGLVLDTAHGERYLPAEQVAAIHERGVDIRITAMAVNALSRPAAHRRVKWDARETERPHPEIVRWLHEHLSHLVHTEDPRLADARERVEQREKALRLAAEDPRLALEAGVGRPDVQGAFHGGVVDVNHAPVELIAGLPGFDLDLAATIVAARERIDGFASLEDFGTVLDLPGDVVEGLRGGVVFLPR